MAIKIPNTNQQVKRKQLVCWKYVISKHNMVLNIYIHFPKKYLKYHLVWNSGFSRTGVQGDPNIWKNVLKYKFFIAKEIY